MIYFIQHGANGPIKVGQAIEPEVRLRSLQTGAPEKLRLLATIPGSREREAEIHRELAPFRVRGEWFAPTAEVLSYLGNLRSVEYEKVNGRAYAVLRRQREQSPTSCCPFCGERHIHGIGDGHREVPTALPLCGRTFELRTERFFGRLTAASSSQIRRNSFPTEPATAQRSRRSTDGRLTSPGLQIEIASLPG